MNTMNASWEHADTWPTFHQYLMAGICTKLSLQVSSQFELKTFHRVYQAQVADEYGNKSEHSCDEPYVMISRDNVPVALFECISPTNKLTQEGKLAYLRSFDYAAIIRCDIIEIDLVRKGKPLASNLDGKHPDGSYCISIYKLFPEVQNLHYAIPYMDELPAISTHIRDLNKEITLNISTILSDISLRM